MLQALRTVLERRRTEGWSVGGTVRDRLMGRVSLDSDVVVADDPAEVARALAELLDVPWFPLSTRHGAYRVLGREAQVDVAALRGDGLLDDLALRDFTINAMALPLGGGDDEVIDPFEGRRHLSERLLVGVSPRIFQDDPLRLMRAVRFCSVLGFTMAPALEAAVHDEAAMVVRAAPERIMAEFALMMQPGRVSGAVAMLEHSGLLEVVIPEIGVVAEASAVVAALEAEMSGRVWQGDPHEDRLRARMQVPVDGVFGRPAALCLAALLRAVAPAEVIKIARRLKLSGEVASLLRTVSAWSEQTSQAGLRAGEALEAAAGSSRAATVFLWQTEPWEPEVVIIASADRRAREGAGDRVATTAADAAAVALLRRWVERSLATKTPPFDGRVFMEALGLEEGPVLGVALREARLAWEAGEIEDLAGAVAVAEAAVSGQEGR